MITNLDVCIGDLDALLLDLRALAILQVLSFKAKVLPQSPCLVVIFESFCERVEDCIHSTIDISTKEQVLEDVVIPV
jgi:hypothetical protein